MSGLNRERNAANPITVVPAFVLGHFQAAEFTQLAPSTKIVVGEPPVFTIDNFRILPIEQGEGAADADEVNRHEEPIENENA